MNEVQKFCKDKFDFLLTFIDSKENTEGVIFSFAKNGQVNKEFKKLNRFTPDQRNFFWNEYIKEKMKNSEILIYKTSPGGKNLYLVLNGEEDIFLEKYPTGAKYIIS